MKERRRGEKVEGPGVRKKEKEKKKESGGWDSTSVLPVLLLSNINSYCLLTRK